MAKKTDKPRQKRPRKLTNKQQKYLNNRIKGLNVMDSHRDAYPGWKGSDKTRSIEANKLEKDPRIAPEIEKARQKAFDASIMTRDEALQRLTLHARVRISDVCDFKTIEIEDTNGDTHQKTIWVMKESCDIAPEVAACIKSVTFTKTGPKIELHDNDKAISQIRAMQGWDKPKKHAITDPEGKSVPLGTNVSTSDIVEAVTGILKNL